MVLDSTNFNKVTLYWNVHDQNIPLPSPPLLFCFYTFVMFLFYQLNVNFGSLEIVEFTFHNLQNAECILKILNYCNNNYMLDEFGKSHTSSTWCSFDSLTVV